MLRCQVRIEPARRRYAAGEEAGLVDLFGTPERWGQTLRPLVWTHAVAVVPPFTGSASVDVPVPCSYDFSVAAVKYFDALEEGEIPLCFLFSGTVFYQADDGALQVGQIAWEKEATYRLPVAVWKDLMGRYYPNCAWLSLRKGSNVVAAYDPKTGEEIWRVRYDGYSVVPRPVFGDGLLYVDTGFDSPKLLAVRPDGKGDVTDTHVAWTVTKNAPNSPSPLLLGDELYMISDRGVVTCLDAKTGAITAREFRNQVLDDMDLERQRGITIQMHPVTIYHKLPGQEVRN